MLNTLAIAHYRSLDRLVLPLARLNVITGANGSGKSSTYRALKLLTDAAHGRLVGALAQEGGLQATYWAGPETISRAMKAGEHPIQGGIPKRPKALQLGFAGDDFGYAVDIGTPNYSPGPYFRDEPSKFLLDPGIHRECIWAGSQCRPASTLLDRQGALVKVRDGRDWQILSRDLAASDSIFSLTDPLRAPEALQLRERMRAWRFYDQLRCDRDAPARQAQIGTFTPALANDGSDLAAALQTILEIGDARALHDCITDAFPGAELEIAVDAGRFSVGMRQHGLLRPLAAHELSDGTLRYLLLAAALLSPRPPELLVLNEPETSLHPDLLPALGRLIVQAARHSQIIVVTHAGRLVSALERHTDCQSLPLEKEFGQTRLAGMGELDLPAWHWPGRS
ncbi:AAA family ATPase [Chitinilyticum litopenaei]|uniref:AAA family ATPase n=1 Tax=Chitinilyticum litopenaei TaxID=1121276 RepID=UPI000410D09D|nr:AAA family ATPase [Chitinilyticum litopenaei]